MYPSFRFLARCIYVLLAAWTPDPTQQTGTKEPPEEVGTGVSLNEVGGCHSTRGQFALGAKQ